MECGSGWIPKDSEIKKTEVWTMLYKNKLRRYDDKETKQNAEVR